MENNERDRKLDRWLDEALSQYSAAEPRLGLEQRVLNRVRAEEQALAKRWNLWRWMPALAAIAAALVVAVAVRPLFEPRATQLAKPEVLEKKEVSAKPQVQLSGKQAPIDTYAKAGPPKHLTAKRDESRATTLAMETIFDAKVNTKPATPAPNALSYKAVANSARTTNAPVQASPDKSDEFSAASSPQPQQSMDAVEVTAASEPAPITVANKDALKEQEAGERSGIIGTEKVAVEASPKAFAKLEKKRKREAAAAHAAQQRADNATFEFFGVRIRIDTPGAPSGQQFPSPAPLSEQEKMMLATAPRMKIKPGSAENAVGIPPIVIKDIEIVPLEGAKK